jgi:acetyltransferase-like isoleucine patch superfamily enzyme
MNRSILYWANRFVYHLGNLDRFEPLKRLRGWHYSMLLHEAGSNLRLGPRARIFNPANVIVGSNCFIGNEARLYAWNDRITIGNNVLIAAEVLITTRNHGFEDTKVAMADQGYRNAPVTIEDDVWIGFRSIILAGVTVGRGSILAANTVVTKDVEPYSIVGGVPARLIRKRTDNDHNEE